MAQDRRVIKLVFATAGRAFPDSRKDLISVPAGRAIWLGGMHGTPGLEEGAVRWWRG